MDISSIKEVRFSIGKVFWAGYDFYDDLEDKVYGQFEKWIDSRALKPKILWDDGETDTQLTLMDLLAPGVSFRSCFSTISSAICMCSDAV